jgi:hypothetical protein
MNKAILLIVPVLALLTTATILHQQIAHASPIITNFGNGYADGKQAAQGTLHQQIAHASPIITNFGNGYADGKQAAQGTFRSGNERDARCPEIFWYKLSYCTTYHIG